MGHQGYKPSVNPVQTMSKPITVTRTSHHLPRLLAARRGLELLRGAARYQLHRPSSVVLGLLRPGQSHLFGQSGASSTQHFGRPDPSSRMSSCACTERKCLQRTCCILGMLDAPCPGPAVDRCLTPSPSRVLRPRNPSRRAAVRSPNSEPQSRLGTRTGLLPSLQPSARL